MKTIKIVLNYPHQETTTHQIRSDLYRILKDELPLEYEESVAQQPITEGTSVTSIDDQMAFAQTLTVEEQLELDFN
jgi:hypothetical protein